MNKEMKIMLSMCRKAIPQLIASEITDVQPMVKTKEHDYVFVSRSIASPNSIEILTWCVENNIDAEFIGTWDFNNNCWKIPNEEHRLWFTLKWT